jgi:hypothetical protein
METTEFQPSPGLHASYVQGERLGAEISELCAHIYAATYRLLVLIREFDEKGYWELPGLYSCAHWLNFQCGIGMNAAREKVRVAHALAELPRISAAFARGTLSYSKVRAMTRIADADNEEYLLMVARHGTAYHVEKLVSRYRRCRRAEALEHRMDPLTDQEIELSNLHYEQRDVSVRYEPDGSMVFSARLPAEQGALLLKALQQRMDARQSAANRSKDVSAETRVREPFGRRIADALVDMAESSLADNATASSSTADRYQVVVHVSAETLQSTSRHESPMERELFPPDNNRSHLEDGPRVSAETSRRIACDCSRVPLLEDEEGEPLSIGRKSRSIPPAIRRALRFRDDGCRFPGCTHKRFVDGHHIEHWADGGETSLDNLVQLCRHHHRLVHEGGFSCERRPGGKLVFRDRRQRTLLETVSLHPVDTEREFADWMLAKVPELAIDAETCVPLWHAGETIDWDYAVGLLFNNKEADENRCLN